MILGENGERRTGTGKTGYKKEREHVSHVMRESVNREDMIQNRKGKGKTGIKIEWEQVMKDTKENWNW